MGRPRNRKAWRSGSAFTLAELMIGILFISIALFGYISLHLRIIHSAFRLEEHEEVRVKLEQFMVKMIARSHVEEVADHQERAASFSGAPLVYAVEKRYVHALSGSAWQLLIADLNWNNDYGTHSLHLESAARRINWSLVGKKGTTLLELMVVMALWAGLLVVILGFYISASEINRRHDKISDSYRKVHELLENMDSLLARSKIFSMSAKDNPINICFARPVEGLCITPAGRRVFQAPETLTLERASDDPGLVNAAGMPLLGQVCLSSYQTTKHVIYKLDLGWKAAIYPVEPTLEFPDPIPGAQYVLELDVDIPVPKAGPAPKSIDEIQSPDIKRFTRLILLENSTAGGGL